MSNTKVYLIHEGCRWEGGSTVGVATNYKSALAEVDRLLTEKQKANQESHEILIGEGYGHVLSVWRKEKKDVWSDGSNIISIRAMEVL